MSGTIDQLNFEVIIKDDKFNAKVQEDLRIAKQLNVELTALLDLQAKAGQFKMASGSTASNTAELARAKKAATDAAAAEERLATAKNNRLASEARATKAMAQAITAQNRMTAALNRTTAAASRQGRVFRELQMLALRYLSIRGASQFLQSMVRVTGEFELQKVALGSMIGDLNQAKILIADIQQLALQSPFAFKELTSYAKQLAAFSVPANELLETTKMLADVSAGLGVGMDRIVLAYGQIRSAAFLRGQEVRQLTEAGIPILAELAKQLQEVEGRAVSAGEVFDRISARLIPFEMVAKVFKDMTSEGGKFFEMQEIQAETLKGKVANLKDAYEMMLNEIGKSNADGLKKWIDRLRDLMLSWEKVGAILKTIIVTYGTYRGVLAAVALYEKAMLATRAMSYFHLLRTARGVSVATAAYRAFGMTLLQINVTAIGIAISAVAGLATIISSAARNANRLNRELKDIGGEAETKVNNMADDIERLVESLEQAKQGTQEYRDAISEINRKYGDYLPKIFSEADGYNEVAAAAKAAEEAIRNKARADAETEGMAAIENEYAKSLRAKTEALYNALTGMGAGLSKKMARDIVQSFDVALEQEGAADKAVVTFAEVMDSYLGSEGDFNRIMKELGKKSAAATNVYYGTIQEYAKLREEINEEYKDFQKDLDLKFDSVYSTKEEREKVEAIEKEYRSLVSELKTVMQSQEAYDEQLKQLDIQKLEKLATVYDDLNRPEIAKSYREQAKALKNLQEGWRGVINETLKGLGLKKGTSFGLWADEFTQSTKYVDEMVKRYKELQDEIKYVETFDKDTVKNLEANKKAIEEVAKALGFNIQELIEYKKDKNKKSSAQKELERQIDLVKKLKASYAELTEFLDDGQMRRILKALFPEAEQEWLQSLDFDTILKSMADQLEKYDEKAASSLRGTIGKDAAKDLGDLFEAFMKYKEAVDDWKAEDFNFYGGEEIGKVLRDLSKDYEEIEKKRRKTLKLLKKAEEGDAEAIALLRTTLGEEVWKSYVTNGKAAIEALANEERDVARKTAEEKAKDKAAEMLKNRMERENIDLKEFSDKSIAQVRKLLDDLAKLKTDIDNEISALEEGGLTEEEQIRLAELKEELDQLAKKTEDTSEELRKKISSALLKIAEQASKTFGDLGKELADLGNATDNSGLVEFGERLSETASFAGDLAKKVADLGEELKDFDMNNRTKFSDLSEGAKAGVVGLIASVGLFAYKSIKEEVVQFIEYQNALTDATHKYHEALLEIRRDRLSNIFGTDEMALAAENAKILNEAEREYLATLEEINKVRFQGYRSSTGMGREGVKNQSLADMLKDVSKGQGWDLYLEDGKINMTALEEYYESFKKRLTRKQRRLIEELIDNSKALNDAAAQQAEYLTDLFSGVADSIADNMIDAFVESGNAAIDMGEIMSDVAKNMVSDLIKSMFIKDVLDQYEQNLKDITKDESMSLDEKTGAALGVLNEALSQIERLTPEIQAIIEQYAGFIKNEGTSEDGNLGTGIKNITEDTANLLASYLNAIRADVSYARVIWERMDSSMQQIAAALSGFSAPSLMEYQAQIASNTYNTMLNTQSILSRLESVMDYESGSASIRVV